MDDLQNKALSAFSTAAKLGALNCGTKNMPYYKQAYADIVLSTVAECIRDKSTITWSAGGNSYNTLYLKWRQARQYIVDNMPEQAAVLEKIRVLRIKNVGIKFIPILTAIAAEDSDGTWRTPLIEYIENASPGEPPFERVGVIFSAEEHEWIKNILRPVMDQFIYTLERDRISILRV